MNKKTVLTLFGIIALFSFFLLSNLNSPSETCTDERYYTIAGKEIMVTSLESNVDHHPPLGKYLIGLGTHLVGFTPLGWRLFPALFGILGLFIFFVLAKEILTTHPVKKNISKENIALLGVTLLSFDFLYFVMSHLAMLDIFVTFFIMLTVFLLWKTIQTNKQWYLIATGISFGLAVGSKWTAGMIFPLFLFLLFQKEKTHNTKNNQVALIAKNKKLFWQQVGTIIGVGIITYILLYIPYIWQNGFVEFVKLQGKMIFRMFWTSDNAKAGTSPFSVFIWTFFPANTLYCYFDRGNLPYTIYLISNPLILWTFWPTLVYNFFAAIKRKELSRLYIATTVLALYIPWMVLDRVRYFFYMLPVIPFLVILITQTIYDLLTMHLKKTNEKPKLQTSYFATKQNPDPMDKLMIKLDTLQMSLKNSPKLKPVSNKVRHLINNKKLIVLLTTVYLLLVILLFILYYPLLNGIPVSDSYRKLISFFWPFLVQ